MNIAVFGVGYVGLVTAVGLATIGHHVIGIDADPIKIQRLNQGQIPIYEPGLEPMLHEAVKNERLFFTEKATDAIQQASVIFITVGTPSKSDGAADLSQVDAVAREIAINMNDYKVIVDKSTVPVGTARRVRKIIESQQTNSYLFGVVSNPEFLREGSAVGDFMEPDRIVVGADSPEAKVIMEEMYDYFVQKKTPLIWTNPETAELIKYASNGFLATKITYINELSVLCETVGADIMKVAEGMGSDSRIGPRFLQPGPGYGGSCFPKDTLALIYTAHEYNIHVPIVETVVFSNETHKQNMIKKIEKLLGDLNGKTIAILGLAFKANTDDVRESPSVTIIRNLLSAGAKVNAHDPKAMDEARKVLGDAINYTEDVFSAIKGADCLVVATEWDNYRELDLTEVKKLMNQPKIVDLRNIWDTDMLEELGFTYINIGNGSICRR